MTIKKEIFISVDIEASGPVPGKYSLLSIGACLVSDTNVNFSCELKPTTSEFIPAALEITGLTLEELEDRGLPPQEAMLAFKQWIDQVTSSDDIPIFVGLNAPFDWSFINYYFHIYLGDNPFGFSALDIKALFMGRLATSWSESKSSNMTKVLDVPMTANHNALKDAIFQANLFSAVIKFK
ncbi:TPA: 3'-5' exoribonuclease [Enterobacter hormaechei]|nr:MULTISPECIES: 3'-5' exonuclease [Enterobacteriaceae]EAU6891262.1 3'-5' exonuclease [Salmonella enterica subsp. enterica serovar Liverpool]ECP1818440.1 3'-5' exonuclease [Salmonella enterica]EEA6265691.1 3'-5' exonuclease [Salmonella enterica subsp. enterica serovar Typhimurium]EFW6604168.1 3'-5' exonuclease [Shigella sonnei]EIS2953381.1 3'-5' exonuclease [Salmonella enterica subsp. enterica serovar Olten]EJR0928642.1 3'-5' exonuclease [Salmonella enterica subsp. enterica]HAV1603305.1 3'-5